jgi:hypothetical protein
MFFKFTGKVKITDPEPFDLECARLLAEAVSKARKLQRRSYSISKWALAISKLRRLDGVSKERVAFALYWYIKVVGKDYIPQAYSGDAFRNKFPAIEASMERKGARSISISSEAQSLAQKLQDISDKPEFLTIIQEGFNEFKDLTDILAKVGKKDPLARYILQSLPPAQEFLRDWFISQYAKFFRWKNWDGGIGALKFKITSNWFENQVKKYAKEYSGDEERGTKLIETIQNEITANQ